MRSRMSRERKGFTRMKKEANVIRKAVQVLGTILSITLLVGFFCIQANAASTKEYKHFTYRYNNTYQGIELLKYKGSSTKVTIPDKIDGKVVKVIGKECFKNKKKLDMVKIPDTVTRIEHYAFYACKSIKQMTLPKNLTYIGGAAFGYCRSLKSIKVPSKVTDIGYEAFYMCNSLESVNLPDNLKTIARDTFSYCYALKSIHFPKKLTNIGSMAFCDCTSLKKVKIPAAVRSIDAWGFDGCSKLASFEFTSKSKLQKLGIGVFGYTAVESIELPASMKKLTRNIFENSNIRKIAFKKGSQIKTIHTHAFDDNRFLHEVEIPENVTTIGKRIFKISFMDPYMDEDGNDYWPEEYALIDKIHIKGGKITKMADDAFKGISDTTVITVPEKYLEKYQKMFTKMSWYKDTMQIVAE